MADPRLSTNGELPDTEHVVRYCGFQSLREDGTPGPGAFYPDPQDGYLSVFWLEFAQIEDEVARWSDLRRRMIESRIKLGAKGKLAKLPVGGARTGMHACFDKRIEVRHMPVLNDGLPEPDESHCGIHGLPLEDVDVSDFLASLVSDVQPAKA